MAAEPREPDLRAVNYLPEFRSLPSAPDAERGALCSFLISPRAVGQVCAEKGITPDHFYVHSHGMIYGTLLEFWQENEPIDIITICSHLRSVEKLENAGGAHFITELSNFIPTAANCASYLETLREKFILREVIKISTAAASNAYDRQDDIPALLSGTVESMMKIVRIAEGSKIHSHPVDELVRMALDRFESDLAREKPEMPTGIDLLDYYTGGFVAPELWVVAARSTQGKSAWAVNVMEHLAIDHGIPVGYISLEMGAVQLTTRLIFSRAKCDKEEIKRRKYMTDEERAAITQAGRDVAGARDRILIREDGALTPSEISATASAWKAKYGIRVLFIDHAQLAKSDGKTSGRTEEVEAISRSMNPLAKRLDISIVILSQVTMTEKNGVETYSAKNSKALEEDADKLLFISHIDSGSWIKISKNREGERGISVPVNWNPKLQRFSDRQKEPEPDQPDLVDMAPADKRSRKK